MTAYVKKFLAELEFTQRLYPICISWPSSMYEEGAGLFKGDAIVCLPLLYIKDLLP